MEKIQYNQINQGTTQHTSKKEILSELESLQEKMEYFFIHAIVINNGKRVSYLYWSNQEHFVHLKADVKKQIILKRKLTSLRNILRNKGLKSVDVTK